MKSVAVSNDKQHTGSLGNEVRCPKSRTTPLKGEPKKEHLAKCFLKKDVFRFCLKASVVCGALRWSGKGPQSGAAGGKDHPWCGALSLGFRGCVDAERRFW